MTDMRTQVGGISLKNPLITASGTCGYGRELAELFDLSLLGGIAVKGTTMEPWAGNKPPRIAETASGMLNSIGLQNPGVDAVIEKELPFLRGFDTAVIVNIAGHVAHEYGELAAKLDSVAGVAGLEVNISCPNVAQGGMAFGVEPDTAYQVISLVRQNTKLPVIAKLTPNVRDVAEIARACEAAGADSIALINTLLGMAIDVEMRRPILASRCGGLSGPAVKPIALQMVWQTARAVSIPIIGMGGIMTAVDAVEFLLAGASAFQVGTALFYNPLCPLQIINDLNEWCDNRGVKQVGELVGALNQ
jgi:dihydroorotate dehydrogenase (NAD+) catalytic subunit